MFVELFAISKSYTFTRTIRRLLAAPIVLALASLYALDPGAAKAADCTTAQCDLMLEGHRCNGQVAPYACTVAKPGCYPTATKAKAGCESLNNGWCDTSSCSWSNNHHGPIKACTQEQCNQMMAVRGKPHICGIDVPYACPWTGGCSNKEKAAECAGGACVFSSCMWSPGFVAPDQRQNRTVTFVNQCDHAIQIYRTDAGVGQEPHRIFTVAASDSYAYTVTLQSNTNPTSQKQYYEFPGGNGINFGAYPSDGDVASMTLFEINMGGDHGRADWYDLSAIPPGSCAAHMNPKVTNYKQGFGYADNLPFKNALDPSQSWGCLQDDKGNVLPKTCGTGLGWSICPEVNGTVEALQAEKGTQRGWGVPGERCCGKLSTGETAGVDCPATSETSCAPNVCAMKPGDDPFDNDVRDTVYQCALRQAHQVVVDTREKRPGGGTPRATGFSYGMTVTPEWVQGQEADAACEVKRCAADPQTGLPTAETCNGYLWPFDDKIATVICPKTPNYRVTICPS